MELQHKVCNNQKSTILNFSSIHKTNVKCSHDQEKKAPLSSHLKKRAGLNLVNTGWGIANTKHLKISLNNLYTNSFPLRENIFFRELFWVR